eukprot:COSAG01_NODE_2225_length_8134_cov_4.268326_6_plen_222_part_00
MWRPFLSRDIETQRPRPEVRGVDAQEVAGLCDGDVRGGEPCFGRRMRAPVSSRITSGRRTTPRSTSRSRSRPARTRSSSTRRSLGRRWRGSTAGARAWTSSSPTLPPMASNPPPPFPRASCKGCGTARVRSGWMDGWMDGWIDGWKALGAPHSAYDSAPWPCCYCFRAWHMAGRAGHALLVCTPNAYVGVSIVVQETGSFLVILAASRTYQGTSSIKCHRF